MSLSRDGGGEAQCSHISWSRRAVGCAIALACVEALGRSTIGSLRMRPHRPADSPAVRTRAAIPPPRRWTGGLSRSPAAISAAEMATHAIRDPKLVVRLKIHPELPRRSLPPAPLSICEPREKPDVEVELHRVPVHTNLSQCSKGATPGYRSTEGHWGSHSRLTQRAYADFDTVLIIDSERSCARRLRFVSASAPKD